MLKVEDVEWRAEGNPIGRSYGSKYLSLKDVHDLSLQLSRKGLDYHIDYMDFPSGITASAQVENFSEDVDYDPKKARDFFRAFPNAKVKNLGCSRQEIEDLKDQEKICDPLGKAIEMLNAERSVNSTYPTSPSTISHSAPTEINQVELKRVLGEIDNLTGLDEAKKQARQIIALAEFDIMKREMGVSSGDSPSYHMVFSGNPGTGKTTFAHLMAQAFHALGIVKTANCHAVLRDDLVGRYVGESEAKTTQHIEEARNGVLFIDEAYSLCGGDDNGQDYGRRVIDTLVPAMENMREELIVILAGYTKPMEVLMNANPGLKSRCPINITFEDFDSGSLGKIMDGMLKKKQYNITTDARAHAMERFEQIRNSDPNNFGNAREVRNLIEAMERVHALRITSNEERAITAAMSPQERKSYAMTLTSDDMPGFQPPAHTADQQQRSQLKVVI